MHKLCKIPFWKKLFAIGFPYKHCNFWQLCLPVKIASKTVIRAWYGLWLSRNYDTTWCTSLEFCFWTKQDPSRAVCMINLPVEKISAWKIFAGTYCCRSWKKKNTKIEENRNRKSFVPQVLFILLWICCCCYCFCCCFHVLWDREGSPLGKTKLLGKVFSSKPRVFPGVVVL